MEIGVHHNHYMEEILPMQNSVYHLEGTTLEAFPIEMKIKYLLCYCMCVCACLKVFFSHIYHFHKMS